MEWAGGWPGLHIRRLGAGHRTVGYADAGARGHAMHCCVALAEHDAGALETV